MRKAGPITSPGWPRLQPGTSLARTLGTAALAQSEPSSHKEPNVLHHADEEQQTQGGLGDAEGADRRSSRSTPFPARSRQDEVAGFGFAFSLNPRLHWSGAIGHVLFIREAPRTCPLAGSDRACGPH